VTFGPLTTAEFAAACDGPEGLETSIYREVRGILGNEATRQLVRDAFPRPEVTRRNTGYALDALMQASCFDPAVDDDFTMCRLLAGSEGTLFVGVEFELNLMPLPPPGALLVVHCGTIDEALRAYHRINRVAVDLLEPGGILVTCSCSGSVSRDDFLEMLSAVAQRSGRQIAMLECRGAAPDHPVSASCLEGEYLKCIIARVA
jgi:FAD/FMN-containing dehydrogenase